VAEEALEAAIEASGDIGRCRGDRGEIEGRYRGDRGEIEAAVEAIAAKR